MMLKGGFVPERKRLVMVNPSCCDHPDLLWESEVRQRCLGCGGVHIFLSVGWVYVNFVQDGGRYFQVWERPFFGNRLDS